MTLLDDALRLAANGFYLFPLSPGSKVPPAGMHFKTEATRDPETLARWFSGGAANIGIYTGRFADNEALLVVDIDVKDGKNGHCSILALELAGWDLPDTRRHATASGGEHLIYRVRDAVRQSTGKIGKGLDIRSRGGYICGPGSTVGGLQYRQCDHHEIVPAPEWLVDACEVPDLAAHEQLPEPDLPVDQSVAARRGTSYLVDFAPVAVEGSGGNHTTYAVAAKLKDFGLLPAGAFDLMAEHWNPRCAPPWAFDDLRRIVLNAYAYGTSPIGTAAPEAEFERIPQEMTAAWFNRHEFSAPSWAVEGLLPEGVTILAGRPKLGKSWLVLSWCIAVALGEKALGRYECRQGNVLYLALEDNHRRLKSRLEALDAPDAFDLHFRLDWKRLNDGGLEDIEAWWTKHPTCRLIVIDTLHRVRARPERGQNAYDFDAESLKPLHQKAAERGVSVVVVHHTRKMGAEDFQDQISGTTGLTGIADTNMVLTRNRGQAAATLHVTGRDIEETDIQLGFNRGHWRAADAQIEGGPLSTLEIKVLDLLKIGGAGGSTRGGLATILGKSAPSIGNVLRSLRAKGTATQAGNGRWVPVTGAEAVFG